MSAVIPSRHPSARRDALGLAAMVAVFFCVSAALEFSEGLARWSGGYERWQLDELPLTLLVLALGLVWFGSRRMRELRDALAAQAAAESASAALLEQNRVLARQLMRWQEDERRTIARELHDELGQYLGAVKVDALAIERALLAKEGDDATRADGRSVEQAVASARAIADAAGHMHDIARGMLARLRPAGLDELGLSACLQELAEDWEQRHGIECAFVPQGDLDVLDEPVRITVYRMVQECLSNIARHSSARHAAIRLVLSDEALQVSIEDDGDAPATLPQAGTGLGLLGMKERVAALGGTLSIGPGHHGLRVHANLPLCLPATPTP